MNNVDGIDVKPVQLLKAPPKVVTLVLVENKLDGMESNLLSFENI